MKRLVGALGLAAVAATAAAQEQQAGNAASTDTEATFQALVDACDDVDALMLRARIRLQIPRATEAAAGQAQQLLEEGFATCASGDKEGAKVTLNEALSVAEAGAAERLSVEEASATTEPSAGDQSASAANDDKDADKPWWQFW